MTASKLVVSISVLVFSLFFAQTASAEYVLTTVNVGNSPFGATYDSARGEVFVTNAGSQSVSVISDKTDTVVATVNVSSNPEGVAYNSAKSEVFVSNAGSNSVSVLSDSSPPLPPPSVPEFPVGGIVFLVIASMAIYLVIRHRSVLI